MSSRDGHNKTMLPHINREYSWFQCHHDSVSFPQRRLKTINFFRPWFYCARWGAAL